MRLVGYSVGLFICVLLKRGGCILGARGSMVSWVKAILKMHQGRL